MLVVDDEIGMRSFLKKSLGKQLALVEVADSVETAEALRSRCHFDVVVMDIRLAGRSGLDWLRDLRAQGEQIDVILMTAFADTDTAVAALRAGAADFILKPFRVEQMLASLRRCLEGRQMARANYLLRRAAPQPVDGIIGTSAAIRDVCEVLRRVAPTASTVLIEGETGAGKELVAQAIHSLSGRNGEFVPVNCGAISPELLESELFGHTRGAFTGAHANREGLFSYAHGGTLFLDEVSELPTAMQAQLLRVLETRTIRPVGSDREIPVDVRVIAATNRHLSDEVRVGRFRQDLYFRLNVLDIVVPPLRDHLEDIPELAAHFCARLAPEIGVPPLRLGQPDLHKLQSYGWPGNIRELRNVIERALLLGKLPGDCFRAEEHGVSESPAPGAGSLPPAAADWTLEQVERAHIRRVLDRAGGNKSEAARRLGLSRKTLDRKLNRWSAAEPMSSRG